MHEKYLKVTSQLRNVWTLKIQYFHENSFKCMKITWKTHLNWEMGKFWNFNIFMKTYESALKRLESLELWKWDIFQENSRERMKNTWISNLNWEMGEHGKFIIFHENSLKRMKNTWISNLNWEMGEHWKFIIFNENSLKRMQKHLNLKSEL